MLTHRASRSVATIAGVALLLTVGACAKTESPDESAETHKVRLYGADGNMLNSFRDEFKDQAGLLDGMKGTTPLTPLSDDFKSRLRSTNPKLDDFLYAAEIYDAIVITALAAQLAGTTDPASIASQINGVTTGGKPCDSAAACLKLASSGTDIEYRGVSLTRAGFTDVGEPSTASYATLHFDETGKLDHGKTEFVGAGDASAASTKRPPAAKKASRNSGAPLKLGELLSETGDLALSYPPLAAGAALAIKEINDAGGALGKPVVWLPGDDGTDPDKAKKVVQKHVEAGVHVIIGAAASGISRAVLPEVVDAGLVLFSPSNTAADLTEFEDEGLYFRTAPSDILQGRALADVIVRDGPQKIVIVARNDAYGKGLQGNVRTELEQAGIAGNRIKLLTYEPPPAGPSAPPVDFSSGAKEIKQFGADAVLVIGFSESAQVIKALAEAGVKFDH